MKMLVFARRNAREILRDPLTAIFSLGFPVVILALLTAIQANVPVDLFRLETLTPGVTIFGLAFMTLFSATLIARDRETALLQLLDLCQPPQVVCVDPVSCAYARVVAPLIGRFHTAKPNRMELEILAGMEIRSDADLQRAGEVVLNKGLKRLFVSLGAEGCFYMDDTGAVLRRKLRPAKMVNASGAGDSFAAAMLYATLQGYDAEKTLDYGMAAGIAAVTHERTINPNMSVPLLESILQAYRP